MYRHQCKLQEVEFQFVSTLNINYKCTFSNFFWILICFKYLQQLNKFCLNEVTEEWIIKMVKIWIKSETFNSTWSLLFCDSFKLNSVFWWLDFYMKYEYRLFDIKLRREMFLYLKLNQIYRYFFELSEFQNQTIDYFFHKERFVPFVKCFSKSE